MTIGARIRQLRHERGWSQMALAVSMGSFQHNVWSWESEKVKPRKASVQKICKAFGLTLEEFMKGVDLKYLYLNV